MDDYPFSAIPLIGVAAVSGALVTLLLCWLL